MRFCRNSAPECSNDLLALFSRSRGILMPSIDTIDELDEVVNDFLSEPSARLHCGAFAFAP